MQKQLTAWVQFREILIFLLIWPIFPVIISQINQHFAYDLGLYMLVYNLLGWYVAARVYAYRIKKYVKPETEQKPYSLKKEIGIFLFIWPIIPILIYIATYIFVLFFHSIFISNFADIFMMIGSYWLAFGWGMAIYIYNRRRKNYFKVHTTEQSQKKNKIGRFIPILIFLGLVVGGVFGLSSVVRIDDGHRDFAPSGAQIRLQISKEECQQYPNRYYFRNLCILCPDEQPLVDGHCQRCPAGELVLSDGCRSCDSDWNYITPKIECDACPNRIYEDDLCKLAYKTDIKSCYDEYPWKGTKEECDACEDRRYTEDGLCESYYHGWSVGSPQPSINNIRTDIYFEDNQPLIARFFDRNNRLIREEHYEYEDFNKKDRTWTSRSTVEHSTYFPSGQLRTHKAPYSMQGYYENGAPAFKQDGNESFLYTQTGDVLAHIMLKKASFDEICMIWDGVSDSIIEQITIYTENGPQQMTDAELFSYLQKYYPVDFELPFVFRLPKGERFECKVINREAEKKYNISF